MTEEAFRELFGKLLEHYQLPPETAAELLKRILTALAENGTKEGDYDEELHGGAGPAGPGR